MRQVQLWRIGYRGGISQETINSTIVHIHSYPASIVVNPAVDNKQNNGENGKRRELTNGIREAKQALVAIATAVVAVAGNFTVLFLQLRHH
jgi:hypothetical protein